MLYTLAIFSGLLTAYAQTRDDCPDLSDDNEPLVPFIDVDESGFNAGGNLVIALAFDHRIVYDTCFLKNAGTETNRWLQDADGSLTADDVCDDMYENDYVWTDMRDVLILKDISAVTELAGQSDKYRYEGIVVCKYTEVFTQTDLNQQFTRTAEHEMDFYINIPDDVTAEVAMTQRLSQPTEQIVNDPICVPKQWTVAAGSNMDDLTARAQQALDGIATVSYNGLDITAIPLVTADFNTVAGQPRGQFSAEVITAAKVTEIDNFMLVNGVDAPSVPCTVIYFTPEAIITNTVSDAYRDALTVTITVTTVVETPWYFRDTAAVTTNTDVAATSITIDQASTCAENDDQCTQTWTIVLDAASFCGIMEDVPITITYTPLVQGNVQSVDWDDSIGDIDVTLAVLAEAFQCSVELAEGEITASADLVIYKDNQFDSVADNTKTAWRTSETPHFRSTVTTTQALLIETTELVTLTLTQGTDVTNIVKNKAAVEPINEAEGRQGRQDIVNSPYTALTGSATTVEFSVNLDLDLFKPFENLDPVDITWSILIEITYTDLQPVVAGGRRRRLLQSDAAPERPTFGAAASKSSWLFPREEDLNIEITVKADAMTEESSSEEVEEESKLVIYVLAAVCVMALGVAVYVLKMIKSIKQEKIRAELNVTKQMI